MKVRSLFSLFKRKKLSSGAVLMYHRIADAESDPWELAVSPKNFEEHLQILQHYKIITLNDLHNTIEKRANHHQGVSITFDDGYKDNYLIAKPLLEKYNLPANFFITTNTLGSIQEFWWDALERICLQSPCLPQQLVLNNPYNISFQIGKAENEINPIQLYYKLCDIFKGLAIEKQKSLIDYLEDWANNRNQRTHYFTMTKTELLDLQSNKLFTLGAHTENHPFLADFEYPDQEKEIMGSIDFLKNLTTQEIHYFAYPHGGRNNFSVEILERTGIRLAFTTEPNCFHEDINRYEIPRFQVKNWNGKTFEGYLNRWLGN